MKRISKILFLGFLLMSLGCSISGCNTVAGFGQDVADTGHTITGAAY